MNEVAVSHPLIAQGLVTEPVFRRAEELSARQGRSVELALNQMGALSDEAMASWFAAQTGYERARAPLSNPVEDAGSKLSLEFLRQNQLLILGFGDDGVQLGMVDPNNRSAIEAMRFATRQTILPQILDAGDWRRAWVKWFETASTELASGMAIDVEQIMANDRDAPIVRKVANWLENAADMGASDVHFEARPHGLDILYRIDGHLRLIGTEPVGTGPSILSRIKVLSGLDLGVRQKPQDGRATIVTRGRKLDIRASVLPSIHGESAVLRLLDKPEGLLDLEGLGFSDEQVSRLEEVVSLKEGLFLVSGPTGSGKTTTLYACIERLRGRGLKILSVEDPIEYQFDHVTQVQVSEKTGLGFAEALRAFLRHDPEVIFVGEIRDSETAQMAVQAAYTGHLVLASIHAISANKVKDRLQSMGVEDFKLDACLQGAMGQRLVRRLCPHCKTQTAPSEEVIRAFEKHGVAVPDTVYEPAGCSHCDHTGFSERCLIADIELNDHPAQDSLQQSALKYVASGDTAFTEVIGMLST